MPDVKRASTHPNLSSKEKDKKGFLRGLFKQEDNKHQDDKDNKPRRRAHTFSRHKEEPPHHHQLVNKKVDTSNMSNPFTNGNFSKESINGASAILGTGSDIAAPRNNSPTSIQQLSRNNSLSGNNGKLIYNPFGMNSRNPSQYSQHHGSSPPHIEDEKRNILPLPLRDPNEVLCPEYKQPYTFLNDLFNVVNNKKLGDGASATVHLIQHKSNHKLFAFKRFLLLERETPQDFYKRCAKEFNIAKMLSSSNHIVDTYSIMRVPTTTTMSRAWGFVLEYCANGDLFGLISKQNFKNQPIENKFCIIKQISLGVKFMHDNGVAHRDLKPENILLDVNGCCKITDFGVADYGNEIAGNIESPIKNCQHFVGSPPYASPEVMDLKNPIPKITSYNPYQSDLWALGMIFFCLIYQGTPFQKATSLDSQYRDYLSAYSTYLGSNPSFKNGDKNHGPGSEFRYARDFQNSGASRVAWRLCDPDVKTRYTMDDLINDPWFVQVEICCDDDFDEHQSHYESIVNSIMIKPIEENNNNNNNHHVQSSGKPSPIIKAKSMLDFDNIEPEEKQQQQSIDSQSIKNSPQGSLNQSLPTLPESNDELDQDNNQKLKNHEMSELSLDDDINSNMNNNTNNNHMKINNNTNNDHMTNNIQPTFELGSPQPPQQQSSEVQLPYLVSRNSTISMKSLSSSKKKKHHHFEFPAGWSGNIRK